MSSEIEMRSAAQRQARRLNELQDKEEASLLGSGNPQRRSASSSPQSLSNDFVVCNTAWSRLSCPTRSILLLVIGVLLVFATYEFGMDNGVREQEKENAKHGSDYSLTSWKVFGGDGRNNDDPSNKAKASNKAGNYSDSDREKLMNTLFPPPLPKLEPGTKRFNKQILINARGRAQFLIGSLDIYYGGREKAQAMLVKSWQAEWQLDDDYVFLDENEDQSNDAVDNAVADEDAADGERHRRIKRNKDGQDKDDDDDDDIKKEEKKKKRKDRKNKKKGVKTRDVLNDPENMSPEELKIYHHHRRQRTSKLVSTMARAVLNPHQLKFIIGTIGSSVAAGHDNCHYDSYESQLERTLTPVFAAANLMAMVQNAGEGGGCGDTHQNQVYCITHNVSPDVDIIHYSWTYFEKETPEVQREQLLRWAQTMERRPMVHHLNARGNKNTCMGGTQANVDLAETYAMYGYNSFCIQTGLYFGGHDYDTENENGINRFGWQKQGDGYHNTTRYGEELPDDDPRKISLGTVYRNWHPGPLGFQIASDAFAYVYTMGLLKALNIIEEDMINGVDPMDRWFNTERRLTTEQKEKGHPQQLRSVSSPSKSSIRRQLPQLPPLVNMPEPMFCDPLYCSIPHPPSCLNYEKPTFGIPGITVETQSNWTISHDPNKWNKMVGKVDIAIIKALHDKEWERKCAHLDACGGVWAQDSTSGTLTYELPSSQMTAGLVFVCGCCGKNVGENMFLHNQNVTIKLNGRVLDKSKMDVFPNAKCIRLLKHFGENGYEKEDTMLLSFDMADQDPDLAYEARAPSVKISHVVAL
mmetsp:Transcript_24225/g.52252  ORF Transcript_24225/g.52252 Transcript_24225/m.52252 type:complete len:808 (+) Transcript_24225:171-2594(+)|eukprot:CAMPEP_0172302564 /NCGR_PEP_ID=MMETSP1058-20130122/4240_1 /TAXON_ID=83371 /ORGANISM="Detonula confervacea, Strain CCMP 353" /LENGTH=807 /DNA_ID=CAMNT_0013013085 /DNA_START=99 /DNA_END=2522 /DNA_ORIENTATION=+